MYQLQSHTIMLIGHNSTNKHIRKGEGLTNKLQLNYSVTRCDIRRTAHPLFTRGLV